MKRVICFGASDGGKRLYEEISSEYEIIAFTDNDPNKWNKELNGITILSPDECLKKQYDYIVITSQPGLISIMDQLKRLGIDESIIITKYITFELDARKEFLKQFATFDNTFDSDGEIAEVGVFQGDFAKLMNEYFPHRRIHLFDTFEGFVEQDIKKEEKSIAKIGEYGNTSIDLVMKKMSRPEMVEIHKGYFPETSTCIKDNRFLFVNLDVDLYEPTYQGLCLFSKQMLPGGVILVHDYFARNFDGPRRAVEQFMEKHEGDKLRRVPIGDKISIMIVGF